MRNRIAVSIPARPDFLHVLRSVIGSVGARLDMPFDTIEDLRLAADEACAQLLAIGSPDGRLEMVIEPGDGTVGIVACIEGATAAWPPAAADKTWGWQILQALTDDVTFEQHEGRPALRLVKAFATPAAAR